MQQQDTENPSVCLDSLSTINNIIHHNLTEGKEEGAR
jgi:hypothetical protein